MLRSAIKLPSGVRTFLPAQTRQCRRHTIAALKDAAPAACEIVEPPSNLLLRLLPSVAVPVALLAPAAAWADEADVTATAAALAQSSNGSDLLVTIFFTMVVGLLSVVTIGVAYLGIMQALDRKQEQDDKAGLKTVRMQGGTSAKEAAKEQEELAAGRRAVKAAKRDKSKGFGSDI